MIEYTNELGNVAASDLDGFFVGWRNPPTPAAHLQILRRSAHVVLARDGTRVVGFINAISDGILAAYIPLLEVLPGHQGRGIGSELVRRMLAELAGLYMIDVVCDPEVQPFYERFGMQRLPAMVVRNFEWGSDSEPPED